MAKLKPTEIKSLANIILLKINSIKSLNQKTKSDNAKEAVKNLPAYESLRAFELEINKLDNKAGKYNIDALDRTLVSLHFERNNDIERVNYTEPYSANLEQLVIDEITVAQFDDKELRVEDIINKYIRKYTTIKKQ